MLKCRTVALRGPTCLKRHASRNHSLYLQLHLHPPRPPPPAMRNKRAAQVAVLASRKQQNTQAKAMQSLEYSCVRFNTW